MQFLVIAHVTVIDATGGPSLKELAIANYKKSLQLDPSNSNAVKMLKKLNSAD